MAQKKTFNPREYMEMAIEVMKKSIQEPRTDKVSPKVGAILIKTDGTIGTAFRGELRHGDHAEFTLLERKNRSSNLDDSILFATLEPCAPGARKHPKLGCAERIVNARVKKVWIGIEDPDPTVDRKGIKYLQDQGIEVEMFDADLQKIIREENTTFIKEALERAKKVEEDNKIDVLSDKERGEIKSDLKDFSPKEIEEFISEAELDVSFGTEEFNRIFAQLGFLELKHDKYIPTGIGLLLFGLRPELIFPNAVIRATDKTNDREDIKTIKGSIVKQVDSIQSWYEQKIGKSIDRNKAKRTIVYNYPLIVFREAIINAIVHRDYDIEGAPIYFEIDDDAITIKSPGKPIEPIKLEQIKRFNAPSLSRNPKIMYAFDQLGLVEQRGLGFQTLKKLPEIYNLPLPIVSYEDPYMVIKFPRSDKAVSIVTNNRAIENITNDELAGYNWIRTQQEISAKEYADNFKISPRTASRHLSKMLDFKLIKTNEENPRSPNLKYLPIE